jgi:hypothetical protein
MSKNWDLENYVEDAKGNLIPRENVRQIDLDRDGLVKDLIQDAKGYAGQLQAFKEDAEAAINEFVEKSAKALKTKIGGNKGNITLYSFDGAYKVIYAKADVIVFDERLQVAKQLVDKCIMEWGSGANSNLMAVVNKAFQMDSDGNVSPKRILDLKSLDIDDAKWKKAMEAIAQATTVIKTKAYLRFYERMENGEYRPISLNITAD